MSTEIEKAMETLKNAFVNDADYAHSWHCNIAMMCYHSIRDSKPDDDFRHTRHDDAHAIGNDAASRFMKLAFQVDTKA